MVKRRFVAEIVGYDDDTYEANKTRTIVDFTDSGESLSCEYNERSIRKVVEKRFPAWVVKDVDIDISIGMVEVGLAPADGSHRKDGLTRWHCTLVEAF